MNKILTFAAVVALSGCTAFNQQVVDPLLTDLSRINNTAIADLQRAKDVALAANPPDTSGATCADAAMAVASDINKVYAAALGTDQTAAAGPLAMAELASLFQPGSDQYNHEKSVLMDSCSAKVAKVLGPVQFAAVGTIGALAVGQQILPLAAAVP